MAVTLAIGGHVVATAGESSPAIRAVDRRRRRWCGWKFSLTATSFFAILEVLSPLVDTRAGANRAIQPVSSAGSVEWWGTGTATPSTRSSAPRR